MLNEIIEIGKNSYIADLMRQYYCPFALCSTSLCNILIFIGACKKDNNYDYDIPNSVFDWYKYGQNIHNIEKMSIDDCRRLLRYNGPWIRTSIGTSWVAENNFSRLETFLNKLKKAGDIENVKPKFTLAMSGFEDRENYQDSNKYPLHMIPSLSWNELCNRYEKLATKLALFLNSIGWGDTILEAWNEPDHESFDMGIRINYNDSTFVNKLSKLVSSFGNGVKLSNTCQTAFCSFMSMNDSKFSKQIDVWKNTHNYFDYYNVHYYDDEPEKMYYWANEIKKITVDRPILITEHGNQHNTKDVNLYRKQAWAFQKAFGDNLKAVIGYVTYSDHLHWLVNFNIPDDMAWKITHNTKPILI